MPENCKAVAERAGLDPAKFDLKTFRSTFASRTLRAGFDVRTVQHLMGHKTLETTMRYLVPSQKVPSLEDTGASLITAPSKDFTKGGTTAASGRRAASCHESQATRR